MHAQRIAALVVGAAVIIASAAASAQTANPPPKKKHVVAERPMNERPVVVSMRPAARVTVSRRSYLSGGTETKYHAEHYQDYAFPPGDRGLTADPNDSKINWNRMPFPNCLDLPGFCR
jgi:hypothetical protein